LTQGGPRNSSDGDGLSDEAGVIPRAIHQIFSTLDENDAEYTVKCSFLELYNEETTDLLAVGDAVDQKLKMLEDNGRVVVQVFGLPPACLSCFLEPHWA
jgi:kinesin family protein 11